MRHQEFEPPPELRDSIKCFWYNTRDTVDQPISFEVVPDGYAEIIFHFGSNLSICKDGRLQLLPSPFMIGLLNQPVVFHAKSRLEIISVRCYPWTVFDLLQLPSAKDGVRIFEHPITLLYPILKKCIEVGRIDEALAHLKQYFLQVKPGLAADSTLFKAGVAMSEANGVIPVSRFAAAAHATLRTLERKFKSAAGYSVKDVSGLMRFEQVRNKLWLNPDCNLAGLSHELGYTDQAHLSREFKRYSGTTPAAFARKAKKDKQDLGEDFIAFTH